MKSYLRVICFLILLVGSFVGGWFASASGYKVVDAGGHALTKSNAAQTVKDENARLQREIVGMSPQEADEHLVRSDRTLWVGVKDGKPTGDHPGNKTFTNLTVEVKDGRVVKSLGWY